MLCQEVGNFEVVWRLPTEVRRWWLSEMVKEREQRAGLGPDGRSKTMDVPQGKLAR